MVAKKWIWVSVLFSVVNLPLGAQLLTGLSGIRSVDELSSVGLPVVIVETVGGEEPTCDYVSPPEGAVGQAITNATKVPGRVQIRRGSTTVYDSGDYEKDASGMTIKIRGNSSAYRSKKPFKIKLQKKADLLSRGDDKKYKDKEWLLLRNDFMSLHSLVGFKVNELLSMQWTPAFEFVNVVFNGDYRGVYMLTEAVKRNPDCRLNVDAETGYIIEQDAYWWNEDVYFASNSDRKYTFKYPDSDDITEEQIAYIREAVDSLEASIQTGDYEKTIDLESFARWVMAHDILGTFDVAGSNIFLTKYNNTKDSKFMMGNLWDFDTIYRMTDDWGLAHYSYYPYFDLLFHSENRSFAQVYKNLWAEIEPTLFDTMTAFLDEFEASETGIALENSRQLDYERWKITGGATVAEDVAMGKEWFAARRSWLNDAITDIEVSSVDRIYTENDARKGTYHLSGRKALPSDGGLIISNGRKFLQKRPH